MRRLCRFTAGFSIGCAACVAHFRSGAYLLAAIAAALCVLALGFRKQLHLQRLLPALLGLSLALAWCGVYRAVLLRPIEAFCARQQAEISAEVLEYPTSSRYGRAVLVCVEAEPRSIRAVLYYSSDETLLPGDRVTCTAKLRAASPDNLERDEYYASRGVWMCASAKGELTVEAGTRSLRYFPVYAAERLKRVCTQIFPADAAGFLQALLTGDKQNLSYALRNDLSRSGVYHVVAVSGMHVSLLAGLVMLLCAKKRVLCAALGIPLVWFFVLLTGANASSVRAGIMQTMLLVSGLVRRERDPWTAFSAALLVLLAENPWSLRNVGLLLSFASTGGILLFSKPLYHAMVESKTYAHLEDHHPFLARGLRPGITATCCSLASSAFSLPICAVYFGVVSVSWLCDERALPVADQPDFLGRTGDGGGVAASGRPIGLGPGWLIGRAAQLVLGVIGVLSRRSLQRGFSGQSVCCGLGGIFLLRGMGDLFAAEKAACVFDARVPCRHVCALHGAFRRLITAARASRSRRSMWGRGSAWFTRRTARRAWLTAAVCRTRAASLLRAISKETACFGSSGFF